MVQYLILMRTEETLLAFVSCVDSEPCRSSAQTGVEYTVLYCLFVRLKASTIPQNATFASVHGITGTVDTCKSTKDCVAVR